MKDIYNPAALLKRALLFINFNPSEINSSQGRSNERVRRIALSAIASGFAQVVTTIINIAIVPLVLRYLGNERYGMWTIISSTISLLAFTDLGLGNGLLNAISKAYGKNDKILAVEYISSTLFILLGVATVLGLVFSFSYQYIPWDKVFNVKTAQAISESGPATAVFMICFLLNIPAGIIQKIQIGYQRSFVNSIWEVISSLLLLCTIVLFINRHLSLPWIVLSMMGAPLITNVLNGAVFFKRTDPELIPSVRNIRKNASNDVLRIGLLFLSLNMAAALGYQSQNYVIAHFLSSGQVTQYSIPLQLFSFAPMFLGFIMQPLWPAYGEAISRGDINWVKSAFRKSFFLSLVISLPVVVLLILSSHFILNLWVGPSINPSLGLLLSIGLWTLLNCISGPIAMFMNGASIVSFQVVCSLLAGAAGLGLSIFLVQRIGIPGPVLGSSIAQIVFILVPFSFVLPRFMRSINNENSDNEIERKK